MRISDWSSDVCSSDLLPGDGIGPEVVTPSLDVLAAACLAVGGLKLHFTTMEAGALVYRERGVAIDDETLEAAGAADAVLLGAMGLPEVRYPDGREISPQEIGRASCRERVCRDV